MWRLAALAVLGVSTAGAQECRPGAVGWTEVPGASIFAARQPAGWPLASAVSPGGWPFASAVSPGGWPFASSVSPGGWPLASAVSPGGWPFAAPASWTTGSGRAFAEDPTRGDPEEVELPYLAADGTRLEGRYARVTSVHLGEIAPSDARPGRPEYRFEPEIGVPERCTLDHSACSRFDAVNVYYHLSRVAAEFWEDRLGVPITFRADAVVHLAGNGAAADLRDNRLHFRLGETYMRNAALEDDIIYHEYAHLVAAHLGFILGGSATPEARAVSEGFADYFAASYTNDASIGEYLKTCTPRFDCPGPRNDPDVRRLDTPPEVWNWRDGAPDPELKYGICTRYHAGDGKCKVIYMNTGSAYTWAMIWGGALWDLRTALGAGRVDALAVEALRSLGEGWIDMESAAAALLSAELRLTAGADLVEIESILAGRGILPDRAYASAAERGPPGAPTALDVFPNPASSHVDVRAPGGDHVALHDVTGRRVLSTGMRGGRVRLDTARLPAGMYRLVVTDGGRVAARPVVVVR